MSVFFLHSKTGERLGFGITLLLAIQLLNLLVSGLLPVCSELLWITIFNVVCSAFSILSLIETCVVLFFAHHTEDHIFPPWFVEYLEAARMAVRHWCVQLGMPGMGRSESSDAHFKATLRDRFRPSATAMAMQSTHHTRSARDVHQLPKVVPEGNGGDISLPGGELLSEEETLEEVKERFLFLESLFYKVDADGVR